MNLKLFEPIVRTWQKHYSFSLLQLIKTNKTSYLLINPVPLCQIDKPIHFQQGDSKFFHRNPIFKSIFYMEQQSGMYQQGIKHKSYKTTKTR